MIPQSDFMGRVLAIVLRILFNVLSRALRESGSDGVGRGNTASEVAY